MKPTADASFWQSPLNVLLLNPRLSTNERGLYEHAWVREQGRRLALDGDRRQGLIGLATSGSSGAFKLVLLSRASMLAAAEGANRHLRSDANDIWLKTLPDFHVGGLSILARAFLSGAKVVEVPSAEQASWSASVFQARLSESRATLTSLVPAQVFDLVQAGLPAPTHLRAAIIGGGALDPSLYQKARRLGWPLLPSYGLTECGSQVATATLESLEVSPSSDPDEMVRELPTLQLLPHIEAKVAGDGRLCLRSAGLLDGYLRINGDEGTESSHASRFEDPKQDSWFTTEDRAQLVGAGRELRVLGRDGDFIKIGGESVDFARLALKFEAIRLRLTGVNTTFADALPDCVILPVPDERLGHVVQMLVAASPVGSLADSTAVSSASSFEHESVRAFVDAFNAEVLPFERIRHIHFAARIPRSALGKLLRAEALALVRL